MEDQEFVKFANELLEEIAIHTEGGERPPFKMTSEEACEIERILMDILVR